MVLNLAHFLKYNNILKSVLNLTLFDNIKKVLDLTLFSKYINIFNKVINLTLL